MASSPSAGRCTRLPALPAALRMLTDGLKVLIRGSQTLAMSRRRKVHDDHGRRASWTGQGTCPLPGSGTVRVLPLRESVVLHCLGSRPQGLRKLCSHGADSWRAWRVSTGASLHGVGGGPWANRMQLCGRGERWSQGSCSNAAAGSQWRDPALSGLLQGRGLAPPRPELSSFPHAPPPAAQLLGCGVGALRAHIWAGNDEK